MTKDLKDKNTELQRYKETLAKLNQTGASQSK